LPQDYGLSTETTLTTTKQADGDVMERPSAAPAPGRKLLVGGANITQFILGRSDRKTTRWLYGQLGNLPVWQLTEGGELYAYEDELTAHFEAKASEAKAARIAAGEAKAAEKKAVLKAVTAPRKRKPTPACKAARPARRPSRSVEAGG
jgi:hypothetical protein